MLYCWIHVGLFVGRGIPCYRDHELTAEVIENLLRNMITRMGVYREHGQNRF